MASDESFHARINRERVAGFERRESELLDGLATLRDRRISALARDLVLETIVEVRGLIQADPEIEMTPDTTRRTESPIG